MPNIAVSSDVTPIVRYSRSPYACICTMDTTEDWCSCRPPRQLPSVVASKRMTTPELTPGESYTSMLHVSQLESALRLSRYLSVRTVAYSAGRTSMKLLTDAHGDRRRTTDTQLGSATSATKLTTCAASPVMDIRRPKNCANTRPWQRQTSGSHARGEHNSIRLQPTLRPHPRYRHA